MLYYIIKLVKLFLSKPLDIAKHVTTIRREWLDDITSKRINEVICVSSKICDECHQPHLGGVICNQSYCNFDHVGRIVDHLRKAVYTIDIAIYAMSSDPIGQELRAADQRGVRVRVICEKNFVRLIAKYSDCILLRKVPPTAPITRGEVMMHHKFCLIDGYEGVSKMMPKDQQRPIPLCMSGSLNWVSYAKSYDDLLITSNPKIVRRLEQEFERIWGLTKHNK